jgi:alpha-tubulin suppressor-like RCC1 family protein
MSARRSVALLLPLVAALAACGQSLYDLQGARAKGLLCVGAAAPITCGEVCSAEDVDHCGTGCATCQRFEHATSFCDASAPELSQHACAYTCDPGFERDPNGPGCRCPAGTALCNGACVPQDDAHCGAACQDCTSLVSPAHGSSVCNLAAAACSVSCAPGFVNDANGPGCVCPTGTALCNGVCVTQDDAHCGATCQDCTVLAPVAHGANVCNAAAGACGVSCTAPFVASGNACVCGPGDVACGGHVVGGACVLEDATNCGASCTSCTAPAGATPVCTNHACDYLCPSGLQQCTNPTTGQPDCCAPACAAPSVSCPAGCVAESATSCGQTCADCTNAATNPLPGAGAVAVCNGQGSGTGTCGFACQPGFFKSASGCSRVGSGPSDVALGAAHTCIVIEPERTVKCWGANDRGQLGDGTTTERHAPVDVNGLPTTATVKVAAIAAGKQHTCAVLTNGQVYCWGDDVSGQLGDGTALPGTFSSLPAHVLGGFTASTAAPMPIAAGIAHTCAINAAGGVACWGVNALGQLGNGATLPGALPSATPVGTNILSGATLLASGYNHTCAVVGGSVKCWGANETAQLGSGTATAGGLSVPQSLAKPVSVTAIATGLSHTCAFGTDTPGPSATTGPFCWGNNFEEELGNTTLNKPTPVIPSSTTPVPVDKLTSAQTQIFTLVSTGSNHTCVAKPTDIAVKCAGAEGTGVPPAVGTTGTCPTDAAVAAGRTIARLFSGAKHNCEVVQPTGATGPLELWCWGVNDRGQLGNGATSAVTTSIVSEPLAQ